MSTAQKDFIVSPGQVIAAREYIKRVDDPRLITDLIRERAAMDLDEVTRIYSESPINESKIHAAKMLIELHGEENVSPYVARLAHAKAEA